VGFELEQTLTQSQRETNGLAMRDYSTCNDVPEGACTLIPSTNSWLDINANEFTTNPTCNTVYSDAVGAVQRTF